MSAERRYYRLTCPECADSTVVSPESLLQRLRDAGMLRRQKDPPLEMIEELLPVSSARFRCCECDHVGLRYDLVDDDWDDEAWGQSRACEQCGGVIPAERVELFPKVTLCVSCQRVDELGAEDDTTYCPRCGAIMVTRLRSGAGIAGYRLYCPECKR